MGSRQSPSAEEIGRLVQAIALIPLPWPPIPRGWPREAEAALIDAVYSMRTAYGNSETTGVRAIVGRWRHHRDATLNDLNHLATAEPNHLLDLLGSRQKVPGRNDPLTKAAAVVGAARNLVDAGYSNADSLVSDGPAGDAGRAYRRVPGLGWQTWNYLLMLLGVPGVKADVMICRFVTRAVQTTRTLDPEACGMLVIAAAEEMGEDPIHVDHTIWAHERVAPDLAIEGRR